MARYTAKERLRIMLRAWRKLGRFKKKDANDRYLFMQNCVDQLTLDGEDDDRARDICEVLWDEGDTSEYE
jgi:hypothetical protein